MSLDVPRKKFQVRLASQCDTSESDAASRVVERHVANLPYKQLCLDDQIVTVQLRVESENIVKLPSEQN